MSVLASPGALLLAPVAIASVCFAASVGDPARFIDWPYLWLLFRNISPHFWAVLGIALCVGTSILGAAWCVLASSRFSFRFCAVGGGVDSGFRGAAPSCSSLTRARPSPDVENARLALKRECYATSA